jgi:hypothetical protein
MVNPSALCVCAREPLLDADGRTQHLPSGATRARYDVVGLRRYTIGLSYEQVAIHVASVMARPEIPGCRLAVDASGVGLGVLERVDSVVGNRSRVHPIILTSGAHVTTNGRHLHVPKTTLAGHLRSVLEYGDIRIAADLEHAALLKSELLSFTTKITSTAHETYEAEQGAYDDLVIACALCIFLPSHLESTWTFISGPASRVKLEPSRSNATRAATMGFRWSPPSRPIGPGGYLEPVDKDRKGWYPVERFPFTQ